MRNFGMSLLAVAGILTASASGSAALSLPRLSPTSLDIVQVQYGGECANWHRQCARLYGGGTQQWNECMHQPQALYDCGGGGGYVQGGYRGGYYRQEGDLCGNWHRECSRLYGYRSPAYHDCLRQPQALADCGRY
jgi:hypothetical protein